uniref:NADP-dependent oxidoreductase domain-containing protein n=1 Tax=Setaria digitata TaxID=48799 RepID=A0A915PZJ5_9BILA
MDENGRDYVRSHMPLIGVGTYQIKNYGTILKVLDEALRIGYRMIDTAQCYYNEQHIGRALQLLLPKYNLQRQDIFLISKLHPANHGSRKVGPSVEQTLSNMSVDYLDLFLIHWPGRNGQSIKDPSNQKIREESWYELEKLYAIGKLRAIGVSNYTITHLHQLLEKGTVLPAVNQCEFHPHYAQFDLVEFCKNFDADMPAQGIAKDTPSFQKAYSSLGTPSHMCDLKNDPKIIKIAKKYNCTIPQFLLAWSITQGISVLPRSTNEEHITENFDTLKIKVNNDDIKNVVSNQLRKYTWDPTSVI